MRSARRWSDPLAMGRSCSAAVAASRSGSDASSETAASGVERDLAVDFDHVGAELRTGVVAGAGVAVRRVRSGRLGGGVGIPQRAGGARRRRSPRRPAPGRRTPPASARRRRGSRGRRPPGPGPGGGACRARAGPCGAARPGRSVSSAARVDRATRGRRSRPARVRRPRWHAATLTSRRPPWLSLRSGSSRKATSPAVVRRSAICDLEQRAGTWCPAARARRRGPSRATARPPWARPRPAGRRGGRGRPGGPRRPRRGPPPGCGPSGRGARPRPTPGTRWRRRRT